MEYIKEVFASYNRKYIRIYQAYNSVIANEAVRLQNFGDSFNTNRMTWIKPSFLWLMYRSNWGTKKNQECILAIDVHRDFFDRMLERAILTSPDSKIFDGNEWEKQFKSTAVYCQWDSDRSLGGNPLNRGAVQLGIKGEALSDFLENGIYKIEDLTPTVRKWNERRKKRQLSITELPSEKIYPVNDRKIRNRLDMR
ncbi:MAG: DUF4291 domain-containing protein [Ruminococcus flavefaciens]|nr:DUF4291 domain-containing protein [Ruminococcus flavefaciens]